jgi:hypothetical protein
MASDPTLRDVAASASEAEGYERLQRQRQRGVHGLLAGLPGLFVALWLTGVGGGLVLLWMALAVLASFAPQLLLPLVHRARPDWQDPVLAASIVKRGTEALFWVQLPFLAAGILPVFAAILVFVLAGAPDSGTHALMVALILGLQFAVQLAATATLAWRSRRSGDRLQAALFWAAGAVAMAALVQAVIEGDGAPSLLAMTLFGVSVAFPPLLAAGFRLMAPRRWLVR